LRVDFLPAAIEEARAAKFWFEDRHPESVRGFQNRLERCVLLLEQHPNAGVIFEGRARRLPLTPYPYSLIYEVIDDVVLVLAVVHAKQRSGYWRER
jgi:toxin ParE1/3/4